MIIPSIFIQLIQMFPITHIRLLILLMNIIRKTNIVHIAKEQPKSERYETPGPGSYEIALPLIKPNYQAIHKKNDIIILKVNHIGQSFNFRNDQSRFPQQKQKSPGPAQYQQRSLQVKNKRNMNKKYSQRYSDLMEFMYKDRIKMSPVPDYKVQYDDQYEVALKKIKNSHRKYKQKIHEFQQLQSEQFKLNRKQSKFSTSSIINIKSTSRLSDSVSEHKINMEMGNQQQKGRKSELRTIDFPQNGSKIIPHNRLYSIDKQQKLTLHRETLYNRNMLGMMMAKKKKAKPKQQKQGQQQHVFKVIVNKQTIDYND